MTTDPLIYLDYCSTTPLDPAVISAMSDSLKHEGRLGNPSSNTHLYGWKAQAAVEKARIQLATLIGTDPRNIIWTSGATESNNLAICAVMKHPKAQRRHIITSAVEHLSVLNPCRALEALGYPVTYLNAPHGRVTVDLLKQYVTEETGLISLMHVNNEIGTINPIQEIAAYCQKQNIVFHVDAAQSVGKLPIDLSTIPIDLMTISAHKCYGPKGVGALYINKKQLPLLQLQPQLYGGDQEQNFRPGTLAPHQLVGFGKAAEIAQAQLQVDYDHLCALRTRFMSTLLATLDGVVLNTDEKYCFPGILNLMFESVHGEHLLLSLHQLAVSSGAACSSHSTRISHVLQAIGCCAAQAEASIRFSFGRFTTTEDIDRALGLLIHSVQALRRVQQPVSS